MGDAALRRAAHAALDAFFDALAHDEASGTERPAAPPAPPAPPRRKGLRAVPSEPVSELDRAVAREAAKRRGIVLR